jgi:hypothetical protein
MMTARRPTGMPLWRPRLLLACAITAFATWHGAAWANNLVQNGNFSLTSTPGSYQFGTGYESGGNPVDTLTDWTTSGYNFVFAPGSGTSGTTADTTGATGSSGNVKLWGPGDGSSNGLTLSPVGGNFVGADGAYDVGAISQTIVGLVPGTTATVSFYWGGAQQSGYTGQTTDYWTVQLGSQSQNTTTVTVPSEGFSGWTLVTMTFTVTAATETLSFTATGTPSGVPPFALLDGVSLSDVPEPGSWSLLVSGLVGLIGYQRWRRRSHGGMARGMMARGAA